MEKVALCAWLLSIFQTKNGGPCGLRGDQGPPCKVQQLSCPGNFVMEKQEACSSSYCHPRLRRHVSQKSLSQSLASSKSLGPSYEPLNKAAFRWCPSMSAGRGNTRGKHPMAFVSGVCFQRHKRWLVRLTVAVCPLEGRPGHPAG